MQYLHSCICNTLHTIPHNTSHTTNTPTDTVVSQSTEYIVIITLSVFLFFYSVRFHISLSYSLPVHRTVWTSPPVFGPLSTDAVIGTEHLDKESWTHGASHDIRITAGALSTSVSVSKCW